MDACPACATPLPRVGGPCPGCGREAGDDGPEVEFGEAPSVEFTADRPVQFRAAPRAFRRAIPTPRPRRSLAMTLALLLVAGGLGTAGYVLLTEPGATTALLSFSPISAAQAEGPSDYIPPVAHDGVYNLRFSWEFQGRDYTWSMNVTEASYSHFHDLERPVRRHQERGVWHVQPAYDMYVSNTADDPFIDALAQSLLEQSRREGFSDAESLAFALTFVQSLPYTSDAITTGFDEWPRFPVETLVDGGGDCEDTSILFASLALAMGFGAVLLSPPEHMAVGVLAAPGFSGTTYSFGGQAYAYAETTGDGYGFGAVPEEYAGRDAVVYDLSAQPLFSLDVEFGDVMRGGLQEVRMQATQTGSAPAQGVRVMATLEGDQGAVYGEGHCDAPLVVPGDTMTCAVTLDLNRVPRGVAVRVRCVVQDASFVYDEAGSTRWKPRP